MVKDFLAFLGLIFLVLIILVGISVIGLVYDSVGLITLPEGIYETLQSWAEPAPVEIEITDSGVGEAEWNNPLDELPTATWTPIPTFTATPVPPLEPGVYRTETILHLRGFADALERWLELNGELAGDNQLRNDPAWREKMLANLDEVAYSGRGLAQVGPAPQVYASIDALLDRVGEQSEGLAANYARALDSGDPSDYTAAGENFTQVKEYLAQAVREMVAAGWVLE